MHLKEFSLVSPKMFKAIEIAIPASAIEQAITKTNVEEKRYRTLQVRPMATVETVGALIDELRVVVIDGTCLDIPSG